MLEPRIDRRLSVAPMMRYTDKHFRFFLRIIAPHAVLYTEMITTKALLRNKHLLDHHTVERPLAIQLGGSDPKELAACAAIAERAGFDEININLGCPSNRVNSGHFGACLMAEPERVAQCIAAMSAVVDIPITVKTRIGIDKYDDYASLASFVTRLKNAGCKTFIIHARKAWLQGLSPKQNRTVPPLKYSIVYRLKREFPELEIVINGGFSAVKPILEQYQKVDGVMIGRAAYHNPYLLAQLEQQIFNPLSTAPSRYTILKKLLPYLQENLARGIRLSAMTRHLHGLFYSLPGACLWRRYLSENAHKAGAGLEVIEAAIDKTRRAALVY